MSKLFIKLVLLALASLMFALPAAATDLLPYGDGYAPEGADLLPYDNGYAQGGTDVLPYGNGYAPETADLQPYENGYAPDPYLRPHNRYLGPAYERPYGRSPYAGYPVYGRPDSRDIARYCRPDAWSVANGYVPPAWCFFEGGEGVRAPSPYTSRRGYVSGNYPIRGYGYGTAPARNY
jgi:hypothetical protein